MNNINQIIAADDLYWSEFENKYVALSEEEINKILMVSFKNGIEKESDLCKVLEWATLARVGSILLKNLLEDRISITGIDEQNEPVFGQNLDI